MCRASLAGQECSPHTRCGASLRRTAGGGCPYVAGGDADDVRLLLDGVGEISGVGHGALLTIVGLEAVDWNIPEGECCGEGVERSERDRPMSVWGFFAN